MADDSALALARAAASAADGVKAEQIKALDVTSHLALTDVFVLASGASERQVDAIVDAVEERCTQLGAKARREGRAGSRWVLLDLGAVVVHVFHAEDRQYYGLDRLWKDCPEVPLDQFVASPALVTAVGE
ncbi:MAG: ribosome silencing factor [Micrococcales bacterium]|nr:ribosome silencing factor [Micrococcales bacterium]